MTEREWVRKNVSEADWRKTAAVPQIPYNLDYCWGRCGILLAAACCRRVWSLLPDEPSKAAVVTAERHADGLVDADTLRAAEQLALEAADALMESLPDFAGKASPAWHAMRAAACLTGASSGRRPISGAGHYVQNAVAWQLAPAPPQLLEREAARQAEARRQWLMVKDIFGYPFRPVAVSASWLSRNDGAVRNLAKVIYDERSFEPMPLLADALEDAGCNNAAILCHCRRPGEHVRGCWVIDLLLDKR